MRRPLSINTSPIIVGGGGWRLPRVQNCGPKQFNFCVLLIRTVTETSSTQQIATAGQLLSGSVTNVHRRRHATVNACHRSTVGRLLAGTGPNGNYARSTFASGRQSRPWPGRSGQSTRSEYVPINLGKCRTVCVAPETGVDRSQCRAGWIFDSHRKFGIEITVASGGKTHLVRKRMDRCTVKLWRKSTIGFDRYGGGRNAWPIGWLANGGIVSRRRKTKIEADARRQWRRNNWFGRATQSISNVSVGCVHAGKCKCLRTFYRPFSYGANKNPLFFLQLNLRRALDIVETNEIHTAAVTLLRKKDRVTQDEITLCPMDIKAFIIDR